ncbi:(-)-germacrene D synthase [Linum perenne]
MYEQDVGHDQTLLKLAKLSWNVLQHLYQQELKDVTKWWVDLDLVTKLPFARDRLIEIYFWAVGAIYYVTKIMTLASVTYDIYDVHGTNSELEMFTAGIYRWDTSMKDLPEYMHGGVLRGSNWCAGGDRGSFCQGRKVLLFRLREDSGTCTILQVEPDSIYKYRGLNTHSH